MDYALIIMQPMFADAFQWHFPVPLEGDWLTVIVDLVRPRSKNGFVRLTSLDPHEEPYINLNYFSDELDILALREGVRFIDEILMNGEGMKEIIGEDYPWPMPRDSDEEMDRVILDRSQTGFRKLTSFTTGLSVIHAKLISRPLWDGQIVSGYPAGCCRPRAPSARCEEPPCH